MPTITYVESDGTRHVVDVDVDLNLMEGATLNMVPGVEGQCGGICSCATCHCYIEGEWAEGIPAMESGEQGMLKFAKHVKGSSRLGCQVVITEAMDGMEIHLPPEQG